MTTYFITFANIFEAAAFKEFLESYKAPVTIYYFNYKACSLSSPGRSYWIAKAFDNSVLSKETIVKYKQVRKGVTRYPILNF